MGMPVCLYYLSSLKFQNKTNKIGYKTKFYENSTIKKPCKYTTKQGAIFKVNTFWTDRDTSQLPKNKITPRYVHTK